MFGTRIVKIGVIEKTFDRRCKGKKGGDKYKDQTSCSNY